MKLNELGIKSNVALLINHNIRLDVDNIQIWCKLVDVIDNIVHVKINDIWQENTTKYQNGEILKFPLTQTVYGHTWGEEAELIPIVYQPVY